MGIVFRQSVKSSIVTITGAILGAALNLAYPYLLSKSEFGLITNIIYTGALIQLIIMLGMSNTIAIYTQKYDTHSEKRKTLLTLGLLVTIAMALLFTIAFFLMKDNIVSLFLDKDQELISRYYFLIPPLIAVWGITTIFEHYLIANVRIAISAFAKEVMLRVSTLILMGLLFFGVITIPQFIYGSVIVYLVPMLMLLFISSKQEGFGLSTNFKVFNKQEYKGIIHFAWYHLLMIVSLNALNFIDTLMLGPLAEDGIETIPSYRIALFMAILIFLPYRAMATSTLPILNEAYINNDHDKVRNLFVRAGINIFIVGLGMFILIALNLDNIITVLPEGYETVKPLVLILMIGKLVDMATGMNNELISISKYYKFNFWASGLLLVMVYFLDTIFIPKHGTFGAAWVATGSLIVFNAMKMAYLYWKMKLHPFTGKTLLVILAGVLAAAAGYFLPFIYHPIVDAAIRSLVIVIVYGAMLLWLKPSNDLVVFLKSVREDKRLF